jgi:protein-S-isoprenylcysteine O-methyltransferase Ste14
MPFASRLVGAHVARESKTSWWQGERGEWFVLGQFALMLLVLLGPRTLPGQAGWSLPFAPARQVAGGMLIAAGGALALAATRRIGRGLTPMPYPKDHAPLIQGGPFAFVRHPIYSGLIVGSFGFALMMNGWLTFVYVAALFVLLDVKSRREERWLVQKFAAYRDYQRRVRKLVPFVY